jgi:hypothetical protein
MAYFLYSALIWLGLVSSTFAEELKITVHTTSGGVMIHARVFAKNMAKHTSESIVIRAMPGATGITAANYLYNVALKNGSEIGTIDSRVFIHGVTKPDTVQYDLSKFGWLGSAVDNRQEPFVLWAKAGPDRLIAGSEGGFAINHIGLVNSILRWDIKEVVGYPDSAQTKLAFEKGEINLVAYNLTGIRTTNPDWLVNPSVLPLVQYGAGRRRHKDLPFVPTVTELSPSDEDKQLIASFERLFVLGRAFAAPPNIPEQRLIQLRALFERTVTDPEYREEAAKIGVIVSPVSWREAEELVKDISRTPPDTVSRLKQF